MPGYSWHVRTHCQGNPGKPRKAPVSSLVGGDEPRPEVARPARLMSFLRSCPARRSAGPSPAQRKRCIALLTSSRLRRGECPPAGSTHFGKRGNRGSRRHARHAGDRFADALTFPRRRDAHQIAHGRAAGGIACDDFIQVRRRYRYRRVLVSGGRRGDEGDLRPGRRARQLSSDPNLYEVSEPELLRAHDLLLTG
jgi:hypothetical protein